VQRLRLPSRQYTKEGLRERGSRLPWCVITLTIFHLYIIYY
jgi:hypothetical protein